MSRLRTGPLAALLCTLLAVAACSTQQDARSGSTGSESTPHVAVSATKRPDAPHDPVAKELPGGGTRIYPQHRLVGYVGYPGAQTLGRLGTGDPDQRATELVARARPYARGRSILPVLEVLATVVQAGPGPSGLYRSRTSDSIIRTYLDVARRHDALLLLNIQPGRSEFIDEVQYLRPWLSEPDVGLALDPEWAMGPGQVPGKYYGWTTGAELDEVARYVSAIVRKEHLPEKAIVYHQVARSVVREESGLHRHAGVVMIKSVDGIGSRTDKIHTYRRVNVSTPSFVHAGFKLFFDEDADHGALMTPAQVLALRPQPEYVMYE
jgi:hypothetical protein